MTKDQILTRIAALEAEVARLRGLLAEPVERRPAGQEVERRGV